MGNGSQDGLWDFGQGYDDEDEEDVYQERSGDGEGGKCGGDGDPLGAAEAWLRSGGAAAGEGQPGGAAPPAAGVEATPQRKRSTPGVVYDEDGFPKPTPKRHCTPDSGAPRLPGRCGRECARVREGK